MCRYMGDAITGMNEGTVVVDLGDHGPVVFTGPIYGA